MKANNPEGRPPTISFEVYRRIAQVRDARKAIPCNKTLARELGLTPKKVNRAMEKPIRRYEAMLAAEGKT